MKKIGFFGGTFDPIHFGHINLAIQIKEYFELDLVLFSPTPCSPFKLQNPPSASLTYRKAMIAKAISGIDYFKLTDVETKFDKASFTIDALVELKKIHLNSKLFLIISNEMLKDFNKWKDHAEILNMADILVGVRNENVQLDEISSKIPPQNFMKTAVFEISATEIRQRLKEKLYCAHLVPHEVLEYIEEMGLYQS